MFIVVDVNSEELEVKYSFLTETEVIKHADTFYYEQFTNVDPEGYPGKDVTSFKEAVELLNGSDYAVFKEIKYE